MPSPDLNIERRETLQALADVNGGVWFCFLHALRGINLVLAETVVEDPAPNQRLDAAIVAELKRLSPQ